MSVNGPRRPQRSAPDDTVGPTLLDDFDRCGEVYMHADVLQVPLLISEL